MGSFAAALAFLVVLYSSCFCSVFDKDDKGTGFSVGLIHRSSPESPFYYLSAARLDLMRASMKYPISPVGSIRGALSDYVMKYSIGTPPLETFAIPDTGSSLTWLQCRKCINCYNQSIPIFDATKSSTYKPILCTSNDCINIPYRTDDDCKGTGTQAAPCNYSVTYADSSYSIGNIARETVTFKDSRDEIKKYQLFDMLFGCGRNNSDVPGTQLPAHAHPGVVSLSNDSNSLIRQLGTDLFSYCFSSNVTSGHSQIRFGSSAILSRHSITTPLISPSEDNLYYFKDVDGLYVDGDKLDVPEWVFKYSKDGHGGLLIDTGTAFTNLQNLAMDALIEKIKKKMPSEMEAEEDITGVWELCYDNKYLFVKVVPEIEFRFKGKDNSYPLSDDNAWIDNSEGQFCLAIERSYDDLSIFGLYQQRDVNVGIDLKQAQISFTYDFDCPDYVYGAKS